MSGDAYTIHGTPSDLMTSQVEGERRLKVEATLTGLPDPEPVLPSGAQARVSLLQEQVTTSWRDHFSVLYQYSVPINEEGAGIIGGQTGSGAISHINSSAWLQSTGVGRAWIESRDAIRYAPGHEFGAEMTAMSSQTGTGRAIWGIGNQNGQGDAVAFGFINGQFGALLRSDGTDTFIPQAAFNVDKLDGTGPSGKTIHPENMNLYRVSGGWFGILPISWWWFAGDGIGFIRCHTFDPTNTANKPHLSNPTLPCLIEVETSGAGATASLRTASCRGGLLGGAEAATNANRQQVAAVLSKSVPASTAFTPLISAKNPTTYLGKVNHIRARYGTASLACDGTKDVEIIVIKNATLTGAAFAPKNIAVSPIEIDTAATAMTGGIDIGNQILAKSSTTRINLIQGDAILAVYPGETITIAARSTGNSVVSASLRVLSEF